METTNFYRKLYFGLYFDEQPAPLQLSFGQGSSFVGPQQLLSFLEGQTGLLANTDDIQHIRIEQYRQVLKRYLEKNPTAFFARSFEANAFATANALLNHRDDLLLANWSFTTNDQTPSRLNTMSQLEETLFNAVDLELSPGYAERFLAVIKYLPQRSIQLDELIIHEPFELLPSHFQTIIEILANSGTAITYQTEWQRNTETDLDQYANAIEGKTVHKKLAADGSLLIIKGKQESELATFLAQLLGQNPSYQPLCILPGKNNDLDNALRAEGVPLMGVQSGSLARPTLQLLKLATIFLWEPIDPIKLLEFLSLASKPLASELANVLATQVAQRPGIQSQNWYIALNAFWKEKENDEKLDDYKLDYNFWFERDRQPSTGLVTKQAVKSIFKKIEHWALNSYDNKKTEDVSLLALSNQAKQIGELLEVIPEEKLSQLEVENVVRTIYKSSPIQLDDSEWQSMEYTYHPGAITQAVDQLLWWNFTATEAEHFFDFWYKHEVKWLASQNISLQSAQDKNALLLWHRKQGVLKCKKQLILVLPNQYKGEDVHPHPLYDNLQASFDNVEDITIDLHHNSDAINNFFGTRTQVDLPITPIAKPTPFVQIAQEDIAQIREKETITGVETFFYYPHQWVFRYLLKWKKSSILSVANDTRLKGNLAHSCFEALFEQDYTHFSRHSLDAWIDTYMNNLLQKEGVSLLMYGMETEKIALIQTIKYAAWSLINLLRNNNWDVVGSEEKLSGQLGGLPIYGRADLVLKRGDERAIIDLKWRGKNYRQRLIRNGEDLQLTMYAHLLPSKNKWPITGYFIIDKGEMITRNTSAFKDINTVESPHSPSEMNDLILQKMVRTLEWRREQLNKGDIEIRCEHTATTLEDFYDETNQPMMDLLEMKHEDDKFDDYRTLIGLVQ